MKEEPTKTILIHDDQEDNLDSEDVKSLKETLGSMDEKLTKKALFIGGVLRGAGVIVGATGLVIIGGFILRYIGVFPGLDGLAEIILQAFDKARLGGS